MLLPDHRLTARQAAGLGYEVLLHCHRDPSVDIRMPILLMGKLRLREVKHYAQDLTSTKWGRQDWNLSV